MKKALSGKTGVVLLLRICSVFLTLLMLYNGICNLLNMSNLDQFDIQTSHEFAVEMLLSGLVLLGGAAVFGIVAYTGKPFSRLLSMMTGICGIMLILLVLLPPLVRQLVSGGIVNSFSEILGNLGDDVSIIGVLTLMLALVMRYGAMLQQESDETL